MKTECKCKRKALKNLKWAMDQEPMVAYDGLYPPQHPKYSDSRKMLLKRGVEEFQSCCDFLSMCRRKKTVGQRDHTSHYLKQYVRAWKGRYISNGALIAAVVYLRIPYRKDLIPKFPLEHADSVVVALSSRCAFMKKIRERYDVF